MLGPCFLHLLNCSNTLLPTAVYLNRFLKRINRIIIPKKDIMFGILLTDSLEICYIHK